MQFKLPATQRIVAFAGPYISLASGALASFLVVHAEVLGSLGVTQSGLGKGIAYGVTAALGAGIPHLGMQKWLDGHQQFFGKVFDLVKELDPGVKLQIAAALPLVEGDIMKALGKVLPGELTTAQALGGDGSGDIEQPNSLIDVEAPALDDPPPAGSLGNDALHAPAAEAGAPA